MLWRISAFPPGFWSLALSPGSSILGAQVYLPASSRVPRESVEAVALMVRILLHDPPVFPDIYSHSPSPCPSCLLASPSLPLHARRTRAKAVTRWVRTLSTLIKRSTNTTLNTKLRFSHSLFGSQLSTANNTPGQFSVPAERLLLRAGSSRLQLVSSLYLQGCLAVRTPRAASLQ